MRILFLSYAYPSPWTPNQGTFNRTMLAALAERHDVHVLCPVPFLTYWQRQPTALQSSPNVTATYVPFYYTPKLGRTWYDTWLKRSVQGAVEKLMERFQPDVMLSYWTHPDGAAALFFGRRYRKPVAIVTGGSDVLLLGRSGRRGAAIRRTLAAADAILPIGDHLAETLKSDGVAASRIHTIYRGVDRNMFKPGDRLAARRRLGLSANGRLLIGVGRLVPVKAWPDVLVACARLKEAGVLFRCHLLGDGPLRKSLDAQIRLLSLEDCVEISGSQPQSRLADWYRAADITVLASTSEGVPNVLLESICCGTPFVATRVGSIPVIADPLIDRLVPPSHPSLLAESLLDSLTQQQFGGGEAQRAWLPPSSQESADRLEAILESLINSPKDACPESLLSESSAEQYALTS